jgi:F-type H+-transporting ATPase subunit b
MPNLLARGHAGRLAGRAAAAWTILLASAGTALAQDDHGAADSHAAAEHGSGGLPQLDPTTFAPQLVWLAITFAVLYFLMTKVALPKVGQVLEERQERITADLEKAQAARDEATGVTAAYEQSLSEARQEAQSLVAAAAAEISQAQSQRQSQFATDLSTRTKAAEERILAAKEQALANVRAVAVEIVQQTAEKLAGVRIDEAEAQAAVAGLSKGRA